MRLWTSSLTSSMCLSCSLIVFFVRIWMLCSRVVCLIWSVFVISSPISGSFTLAGSVGFIFGPFIILLSLYTLVLMFLGYTPLLLVCLVCLCVRCTFYLCQSMFWFCHVLVLPLVLGPCPCLSYVIPKASSLMSVLLLSCDFRHYVYKASLT